MLLVPFTRTSLCVANEAYVLVVEPEMHIDFKLSHPLFRDSKTSRYGYGMSGECSLAPLGEIRVKSCPDAPLT